MRHSTRAALLTLSVSLSTGAAHATNLLDVYQMALENDPTIIASEYQRLASIAAVDLSKSARMPTLAATVSAGVSKDNSSGNPASKEDLTATVQARLPLYNRGNNLGIVRSNAMQAKAEANHAGMQQDMIRRVADSYFGVLRAQDNVEFSNAEKDAISRQLEQTKRRFEVGLVAVTDVTEAQASYDSALANSIVAENQLSAAHEALRIITGSNISDIQVLRDNITLAPPSPNDVDVWVKQGNAQNSAIRSATEDLNAAILDKSLAGAVNFPSLDLIGNYQRSGGDNELKNAPAGAPPGTPTPITSTFDNESHEIKLQLTWSIYNGGAVSSTKQQAGLIAEASANLLERATRESEQTIRTAFSTVQARISQVKALKRALQSNQVRLDATRAGYEAGTRTAVDILNAIRIKSNAAAQHASARYDYILSMLDLRAAVGSLSEPRGW